MELHLLTVREAAQALRISRATFYRLRAIGDLPGPDLVLGTKQLWKAETLARLTDKAPKRKGGR
jgi:excisionase family DNA binding protein